MKTTFLRTALTILAALMAPLMTPQLRAATNGPNVVLITVDTLRADRLGCYGNAQIATPRIDALAARGSRFAAAYSQVPFTLPSHASLFTSTYPAWNGVEDTTGPPLDARIATLAELLQRRGYATAGFPAAFVLDRFFGLGRGFSTYYGSFPHRDTAGDGEESGLTRTADQQLPIVFDWLDKNGSRKFFIWVHLYDTHHPYNPPEPYRSLYPDRPYDAEVAYIDSAIGKLLDYLARKQGNTIVVLTSDHGEGLGQHGEQYHGYFTYNSTLRVPLIIYDPAAPTKPSTTKPSTVTAAVRLVDVAPTILQLVGVAVPPQMQGQSLVPLIAGKPEAPRPIQAESLFPSLHFGWSPIHSLQLGHFKYIDVPRPELYDLSKDPDETSNIYSGSGAIAEELQAQLRETTRKYTTAIDRQPRQLSEEAIAKLQKLGYVADAPKPATPSAKLADPKDTLPLYNLYLTALDQQETGRLQEAVLSYQQILRSGYEPPIAYHGLGNLYLRLHEYPQAIENLKRATAANPASEPYLLDLARAYEAANENKQAAAAYLLALGLEPRDYAAMNNLAVMYIKLNDWQEATHVLEGAAGASPLKETYYHLGICYEHQGEDAASIPQFQKAIALDPEFAAAHYNLGVVETKLGSAPAAIAEFKKAIQSDPNLAEAHFSLGVLDARASDDSAAREELQKAVELRPDFAEAHFNLAVVAMKLGKPEEALAEFDLAIKDKPGFLEAHRGRASLYKQMGMEAKETSELETIQKLEQGTAVVPLAR